jgi:hypothetical protein
MQMQKYHWKRLRNSNPCRICNEAHPTKTCVSRRGVRRESPFYHTYVPVHINKEAV